MTKDNKKMKSKNKKHTLGKPDAYLLLLFTIEIIFVIWVFFNGGKDFFINDTAKIGILLPLGLLTFVSVFFGFIFSQKELMKAFIDRMSKIDSKFKKELKGYKDGIKDIEDYKDIEDIKDWIGRYKEFKEYKRFVNPILWLYVSIFLSLITIILNLTNIIHKPFIISLFVHLSVLATFFLVTSVASLILSYYLNEQEREKEKNTLNK